MGGKAYVKLDFPALAGMTRGLVADKTNQIASRAGEGFVGDVMWTDRPHGAVRATTRQAARRNARDNTLLKATFGG